LALAITNCRVLLEYSGLSNLGFSVFPGSVDDTGGIRVEVGISANRPAKRPESGVRFHVPVLSKPIPMLTETKVLLVFTSSTIFLHNDPNQD
jgi:hypothetical protein